MKKTVSFLFVCAVILSAFVSCQSRHAVSANPFLHPYDPITDMTPEEYEIYQSFLLEMTEAEKSSGIRVFRSREIFIEDRDAFAFFVKNGNVPKEYLLSLAEKYRAGESGGFTDMAPFLGETYAYQPKKFVPFSAFEKLGDFSYFEALCDYVECDGEHESEHFVLTFGEGIAEIRILDRFDESRELTKGEWVQNGLLFRLSVDGKVNDDTYELAAKLLSNKESDWDEAITEIKAAIEENIIYYE